MGEYAFRGDGEKQVSIDEDGAATISSDKPVDFDPALPVTDVRVNLLEVTALSLTVEGSTRIVRGQYADGGSFEVSLDWSGGKLNASGHNVTTVAQDGADRSHTVLTYLPKVRSITKVTH
ncbi:hypothetical protein [Burkholderia pseudomallei]|uniref:hypothetical protein n=1 Tax=Burkholderia pseudomallei TaxID=28450 RepID=UPI000F0696D4|nr:hypothetical protein [Burkholderia pseudomallei]CAJ6690177.1 Uncharacterised protein [Burkholderia pseudomallei]VBF96555.1 Uncharacterised protein [Burkholderia pseudomallei]